MIKKIIVSLVSACVGLAAMAQFTGNGYYRVQNYASERWAYLTDNHAPMDASATKIDLAAIELWKDAEKYHSDPSTIIYIEKISGSQYDIHGQGTSVHQMADYYLNIAQRAAPNTSRTDTYVVYGSYSGIRRDLTDPTTNLYYDYSYLSDKKDAAYPQFSYWYLRPVSSSTDYYFGIKPSVVAADGKRYAAIYTGFPYQVSGGVKAYYVYKLDATHGIAIYKEVPNGIVDKGMGSFQLLPSDSPAQNKVEVGAAGATKPSDNKMLGAYFSRVDPQHTAFFPYKAATMRLFGKLADGSIGFITPTTAPDNERVPANTSFLVVPADSPADYKLMTDDEYAAYIASLPVEATSVTLNTTSLTVKVGESAQLTATVAPANTTDKTVTWTSSNTGVATVDANGKVTAMAVGTATITAKCGNVQAVCAVTVNPVPAESITLSATSLELLVGASQTLTATVAPANTTDKTVTWTSSNTGVATVDANGKVTAVAVGTATITAKCGNVQATCAVTVNPVPAESITLSAASLELLIGSSQTLTATVAPANTTDKTVTWTSSNSAVATVDANGKVTAVALGTATITAKCGSAQATCSVAVKPIMAQSIELSATSLELVIGSTEAITATVKPDNTTDKTVTWTSSNPDVATVNAFGVVSAKAVGTATITAACGNVNATCHVSVLPIVADSISLSTTAFEILEGETRTIIATIHPDNVTDKTLVWTSSAPAVATVDANGLVTAVAQGEAVITVACGEVSASCAVTVIKLPEEYLILSDSSIDLLVGASFQLAASVYTHDGNDAIAWSTSNAEVATVTADGLVQGVGAGQAVITAVCGSLQAQCVVSVIKNSQYIVWEQEFDDVKDTDVIELTAYATSGLEVVYEIVIGHDLAALEGATLSMAQAGIITIEALQEGDVAYMAAEPVRKTVSIASGIADAIAGGSISLQGNAIVNNCGAQVKVYTVGGALAYSGNDARIELAKGAYVVTFNGVSFKVCIR